MVTDPIADMLVRIKNAGEAKKAVAAVPYSNMLLSIANVLLEEKLVASVEKKAAKKGTGKLIEIGILYDQPAFAGSPRNPRLSGLVRVSRPSRRTYTSVADLRPIREGRGVIILSTPKGVMSDSKAKKEHVGGEVLCKVW